MCILKPSMNENPALALTFLGNDCVTGSTDSMAVASLLLTAIPQSMCREDVLPRIILNKQKTGMCR